MAWKLDDEYSKEEILEFYLNTVPFGRGAYGIEAAAQAFFGKTAAQGRRPREPGDASPRRWCWPRWSSSPSPTRTTPRAAGLRPDARRQGPPELDRAVGVHPRRHGRAGLPDRGRGRRPRVPGHRPGLRSARAGQSGLDRPTGLVVNHVLSELRGTEPFRDRPPDYIAQRRVPDRDHDRQAGPGRGRGRRRHPAARTAPEAVRGPARELAGGAGGRRARHRPGARLLRRQQGHRRRLRGLVLRRGGQARGFGQHPPGSSFKVYDLAEAMRAEHLAEAALGRAGDQGVPGQRPHPRAARPGRSATPAAPRASRSARCGRRPSRR